jgi:hypothetical protein
MTKNDALRERELRKLAAMATDATCEGSHVEEPLLALMRDGDVSDDLADAIAHVATCADCRARLTEGRVEQRSLVVVAIEAPRASQRDLQAAAADVSARLVERGQGRFVAVVDAERAESLKERLEKPESSVVSRLAVGTPFEVPVEELHPARRKLSSIPELPAESGTDAAEVQAWAQVARKPRQRAGGLSAGWVSFAIIAIAFAVGVAYFLATR